MKHYLQTLDEEIIRKTSRTYQTEDGLEHKIRLAQELGMWVSLDLMVGLAGQTAARFHQDVEQIICLAPNQEAQAEGVFAGIESRYQEMQRLVQDAAGCPTVLLGYEINGTWHMPGGKSYQAAYIRDAGGCYLWAEDETTGRIPLSFEVVYAKGADAEYWFNQSSSWQTAADVLGADPRYEKFNAFAQGNTYNNNARVNPTGGNDYNESGHANPDLVLADLIAILHPELLPDHTLIYHCLLDPGAGRP